ncbi:MAG: hypothetical protein QGI49_01775 [SAR202 cluster bacterium]|jgi:hypothetical protein|nr:hypothetical protein [SAR202 cluster bacterium]
MTVIETTAIGSRRELFVDELLVDRLDRARLKLHDPKPGGTAINYDTPWEGYPDAPDSFYTTVLREGDTYRMYYRGGEDITRSLTCYAKSSDGITWIKPRLGLVEVDGSTDNNVIGFPNAPQFCAFRDTRPGVPELERYKANALRTTRADNVGLFAYVSGDGIHWSRLCEEPIVANVLRNHFDSQNVMFWSEVEEQYVLYARHMVGGKRATARATSYDFLDWTEPTLMTYSDTGTTIPSEHLYTNQTHPYFRAPHIYISLAGRIFFDRRTLTDEEMAYAEKDVNPRSGKPKDCSDGVLLTTRAGTTTYNFTFKESFVRPGIGYSNWTTRNNYPALGVVQTGSTEMSFYVQRDYAQKTSYLERMTLRLDGFASLNAPYDGGEMTTRPLTFEGNKLEINYSTSAAGSIKVELQDAEGRTLPGYGLRECRELIGDEIEGVVAWEGGSDLGALTGKPVRLRFAMRDADVFSFQFKARPANDLISETGGVHHSQQATSGGNIA